MCCIFSTVNEAAVTQPTWLRTCAAAYRSYSQHTHSYSDDSVQPLVIRKNKKRSTKYETHHNIMQILMWQNKKHPKNITFIKITEIKRFILRFYFAFSMYLKLMFNIFDTSVIVLLFIEYTNILNYFLFYSQLSF